MNDHEKSEASRAIGMMLAAFPSSQSNIGANSAKVYVWSVDELSLEAVNRACRKFVRGEVLGRNNGFAPSAPELAEVAKQCERELAIERRHADRVFVEEGSEIWQKLMLRRDRASLPMFSSDGRRGWTFTREEITDAEKLALPPPLSSEQMAVNRERLKRTLGYSVGDPEGDEAAA